LNIPEWPGESKPIRNLDKDASAGRQTIKYALNMNRIVRFLGGGGKMLAVSSQIMRSAAVSFTKWDLQALLKLLTGYPQACCSGIAPVSL
jgi:hypothetical protein